MIYTIASLEVSAAVYDEIATKLKAAGYNRVGLNRVGPEDMIDEDMIDMRGIGLVKAKPQGEVFSRPECVFGYCPTPKACQQACALGHKAE